MRRRSRRWAGDHADHVRRLLKAAVGRRPLFLRPLADRDGIRVGSLRAVQSRTKSGAERTHSEVVLDVCQI